VGGKLHKNIRLYDFVYGIKDVLRLLPVSPRAGAQYKQGAAQAAAYQ